jgi:glucan biosynthesis protein C
MANPGSARSSLAIDNLRAIVILLVLAFHSVLAYLSFLPPHPFPFDAPPFEWRSFPVVDAQRWIGFDLFCAWLDVFLMSFFFMLSGLFAWPSLTRKGAGVFARDRLLRLGLPFAVVVLVLMPLAHYPVYLQTATDPGIADFWRHWRALPLWPSGPMWFLWLLLVGDIAAAGIFRLIAAARDALVRLSARIARRPPVFLAFFAIAAALAYIPLALAFGPFEWSQRGPFPFQLSRPLHYALYFAAGIAIGACGIERGLIATDGPLARYWSRWALAAPPLFALWLGMTALAMRPTGAASFALQSLEAASFVLACLANCFGALALAVRFGGLRSRLLDSLKANAYGMFLIHYVFVVWLQYALRTAGLPAAAKAAIVFGGTVLLSWSATAALRRVPAIAHIIGAERRRLPATAVEQPAGVAS